MTDTFSENRWIDSHCHFDFPEFDHDRDIVWQHCQKLGVARLLVPGISRRQGQFLPRFASRFQCDYALGLHPFFLADHQPDDLVWLDKALEENRVQTPETERSTLVAVGEFGLDFRKGQDDAVRHQQRWLFHEQLRLARHYRLPVILHGVGAHDEIIRTLRQSRFDQGGVIHAFSGSEQQARQYLELGFRLGLGGLLLSPRAHRLRRTVAALPSDSWILETDAPDMTPAVSAEARNSPVFIPLTGAALASIKNTSVINIQQQQQRLYRQLFHKV